MEFQYSAANQAKGLKGDQCIEISCRSTELDPRGNLRFIKFAHGRFNCDLLQGQEPYQATLCMAITIPMIAMDMAPMSLESWEASPLVLLRM